MEPLHQDLSGTRWNGIVRRDELCILHGYGFVDPRYPTVNIAGLGCHSVANGLSKAVCFLSIVPSKGIVKCQYVFDVLFVNETNDFVRQFEFIRTGSVGIGECAIQVHIDEANVPQNGGTVQPWNHQQRATINSYGTNQLI